MRYRAGMAVALAMLALQCGGPASRRDLVVVQRGLPLTLVPNRRSEVYTNSAQANIMESLVAFDAEMRIEPQLAERWENPDDLTWLFHIRPGVAFSDGRPLTVVDAVYSLNAARSGPGTVQGSSFITIDSIAAVDARTLRITTVKPDPILLNKLVMIFIVPNGSLEPGAEEAFGRAPVGTGPYRMEGRMGDRQLVLQRCDGYWGPRPAVDRIVIRAEPDQKRALRQLRDGSADLVPEITPEIARRLEGNREGIAIERRAGLALRQIGMNVRQRPFSDPRVRQAISCALDRQRLVDTLLLGYGSPINQLEPQGVFGFNPDLPPLAHQPERARELLAQAGYARGLDLTLLLSSRRMAEGEEIRRQLAAAGIRVRLNALPRDQFFAAMDTSSFYLVAMISMAGDASELFDNSIHSRFGPYGHSNRSHYANPAVDRLIESSSGYISQSPRLKVMQEIMARAMADLPLIPVYVEDEIYARSGRIQWRPRMDALILGKEFRLAR